ncbi:MAG: PAS domain S-box protein, partial [Planctomycetes bacterium]|nr:PAS domain S-box protein [Planctomycetota bacterium]
MKPRSKLVWKLTAVAAAILIAALALSGYVDNLITPVLLGVVALWFTFGLLLERPIQELIEGTQRIGAHQLDFRFEQKRRDEIGLLEESFNAMAATIQTSQEELRGAKEYLEGIFENSADLIITVDPEGMVETFNRGAEEALGYGREEVVGKPIEALFADPRERDVAIAQLKDTDHVKNYQAQFLAKDGQIRNVLLTLSRLRDRDGNPIGTFGISKDITQEKKLQDELRDAKEYLEGIIEHSADIIITVNSKGLIETFNRGGEEALGYARKEVIGRRIESLYIDPRERHAIAKLLADTSDVKNYETHLLAKDGGVRNVLLTLSRFHDRQGNPIGTIGISKDITQERMLQRELAQSQKFAAIGQAVTGIQHAIKNMLNALKGGAYLVRNGMAKDNRQRVEEGWAMVEEGIQRINSLSLNMLNFAREWKPELERVDLNDLVASVVELNRQAAADRGVTLRHEVSQGLPPVLCDPTLIHMATTDIVVNAIDACTGKRFRGGKSPEIVLGDSPGDGSPGDGGDFHAIEIRDNGCGMTEATRKNIFTPF